MKLKLYVLWLILLCCLTNNIFAQLAAGDLVFISCYADNPDEFSLLVTRPIPPSEVVYFTDNEFDGTEITRGEGKIEWTAPSCGVSCGTIITYRSGSFDIGTITDISGSFAITTSNEGILVYQAASISSNTPTNFICALQSSSFGSSTNSQLPTGLTLGIDAIELSGRHDNGAYDISNNVSDNKAALLTAISDLSNWNVSNSRGSVASNKNATFTITDCPRVPSVGFDLSTTTADEGTTASVAISVSDAITFPITLNITSTLGTAESGDFTAPTTLTFNTNSTQNISVDFTNEADLDDETFTLTISENTSTCIDITNATHDFTILDDDVCSHSITSFTPSSAPAGAKLTIHGTGFSSSAAVTIGGVAAMTTFVDANTLIAQVPAMAVSGDIVVTQSPCDFSLAGFNLIEQSGTCSSTALFSDLIISEVYDAGSGSLGYIEIYNGTGATINLSTYKVDRFANSGLSPSPTYSFPSSGVGSSIADGEVLVGKIGSGGSSSIYDFTFVNSNSGYNEDDRLMLRNGSVSVDEWKDDNVAGGKGYIYRRNTNITGPSATYNTTEWTDRSGTESTSDLGVYSPSSSSSAPTINTQPTSISACEIDVSATAVGAGALTYQWFYNENDGIATTWTAVNAADFPDAVVLGEDTDNLLIGGTMNNYDGYQFYCLVTESGACSVASEAIQYTLSTGRFFRTNGSGLNADWDDASSWEVATSIAGPYTSACSYPVWNNSDTIIIQSFDTIQLDVNDTLIVDQMYIEEAGMVEIDNNSMLLVHDESGVDITIDGTLLDNGTTSGVNGGLSFMSGATWIMGTALSYPATIIKTRNSSISGYKNNYENGIANIPVDAEWYYRYTGVGTVAVLTTNMVYPNLFMENTTASNYDFNGVGVFQGTSGFATVKGDFNIGTTGNGAVDVFNENNNTNAMLIMGDMNIGGVGSGTSRFVNNNGGTNIGTGIEIRGDLNIDVNGQLDFSDGNNGTPDGVVILFGDWTDLNASDGFRQGESRVEFAGTTDAIVLTASVENFNDVNINKTGGAKLNIDATTRVDIQDQMGFVQGIVDNSFGGIFHFEKNASVINTPSNTSHINGPVQKETANGSSLTFTFPTGKAGQLGRIGIKTNTFTGDVYTAEYFFNSYADITHINTTELDHVSSLEYWDLSAGAGNEANVTLFWDANSDVVNPLNLRVGHYLTQAPSTSNQWEREGNSPTLSPSYTINEGAITSDNVTSFSPFTLAEVVGGSLVSLPLELLTFDAKKVGKTADLKWAVANDQSGHQHCVERSKDGIEFTTLSCLDATTNQSIANYSFVDANPYEGVNYYRIAHTDRSGLLDYSLVKALTFHEIRNSIHLYPNPNSGKFIIELENDFHKAITLELVDVLGRVLDRQIIQAETKQHPIDLPQLPEGTYIVRLMTGQMILKQQKMNIRY